MVINYDSLANPQQSNLAEPTRLVWPWFGSWLHFLIFLFLKKCQIFQIKSV